MKSEDIISQLDIAFKGRVVKPSACITKENDNFFYIDDNTQAGKCIVLKNVTFSDEEEQKYFKVVNENEYVVNIWSIDGCFLSSNQQERCDCAFFDENDFCFVEFKLNATSKNPQTIKDNREKAINQLRKMILMLNSKFQENKFSYLNYNLEAYICTPIFYPNKNTAISDYAVEFLEEYGVKLFEQNNKKCL